MPIKLSINGVEVEADEDANVLDTARSCGFEIPSLCHHETIEPYGACRLCLVEVEKGGKKKITTSCNYQVQKGINVITDSPNIRKHRAMVLELILAEAPDNEHIKKLAAEYGVYKSRFASLGEESEKREDCILCGLCSRVCSEIVEVNALTFRGRGDRRHIGPVFKEESQSCIACGACAWVCPTNCIGFQEKDGMRTVGRWGRALPLQEDQDGMPFAPKFQLYHFSKKVGLAPDFFKKAPGAR